MYTDTSYTGSSNMYGTTALQAPVSQPAFCPYWAQGAQRSRIMAYVKGGPLAPGLNGIVTFSNVPGGTEVYAEITGLPPYSEASGGNSPISPFGFHIHEKDNCQPGTPDKPFPDTGEHWNPYNQPHGNHAGDFPVLFSNHGYARMSFFTDKFRAEDVIGKSVIIHQNPDDYRTQPAGNSGKKLACGAIRRYMY